MEYLSYFFAGAFSCNCIPHLVSGLQGIAFPTPFARPRGVGKSSPLINFAWGLLNLLAGLALLSYRPVAIGLTASFGIFLLGVVVLGSYLSVRFSKVHGRSNST